MRNNAGFGFGLRAAIAATLCIACAALVQTAAAPRDPFQWSHTTFPATTLGLAVGSSAPNLAGVSWAGRLSVVLAAPRGPGLILPPAMHEWSALAGLQVEALMPQPVVSAADRAWMRDRFGDQVLLVTGGAGASAMLGFKASGGAWNLVFLIDATGQVVYRVWNPSERHVPELDRVVRSFAGSGAIPADAVAEQPLAAGDLAPSPSFSLETPSGGELALPPDQARLVFCGSALEEGLSADVRREVGRLQEEFPQVEFLWVTPYVSLEACRAIWETGQRLRWNARGQMSLPLDQYLQTCTGGEAALRAALAELAAGDARGWRVSLDRDYRLQRLWTLFGAPSVCVLDGSGYVAFPCTFYTANRASGTSVFPDGALDALRAVLKGVTP